jgi:oligoendopeptidase F
VPLNIGDFKPRFLDPNANLGDPAVAKQWYDTLETRTLGSISALEAWLGDWSEVDAWLDEEASVRYVESTCQTDDPVREKRYLDFIENVSPVIKSCSDRLNRKLLACDHVSALPKERYEVFLRAIRNQVALFREANIPLQTEDEKLRQQYQKLVGCMTVQHDGREQTLEEMGRYQEEQDRAVRQETWEKVNEPWLKSRDAIDDIYDQMVELRQQMARNAGFENYRDLAFAEMERFDYTPADCETFADTIERVVVPVAHRLGEERKAKLGVESLRPWDMYVDLDGRPPLKPFTGAAQLMDGVGRIFTRVAPELGEQFARMRREGLLDLESRKGKAPGGYMMMYEGRRLPFIFMNAVGTHDDVQTMLHEGGHAFHGFAARNEDMVALRDAPIEFCEVASMAMELLAGNYLDEFYSPADANRARTEHLQETVKFFPWMACVDMIQHWVYTHAGHSHQERSTAWQSLNTRFNHWVDYTGYEDVLADSWHRKGHPFTVPFYYVEYGIAQLGALGVWRNSRTDHTAAVTAYRRALSLGGRRPLPELFSTAGVKFDFSEATVAPLIAAAQEVCKNH